MDRTAAREQKGWYITALAACINLGNVLFVWSIFKVAIKDRVDSGDPAWNWKSLSAPYSLGTILFASSAWASGYLYDMYGPRLVTTFGGVMQALGLFLCSLSSSIYVWCLGFGICLSCGLGACYAAQTPTAVKWFPPTKTGLIAGIVVGGFGMSPVYLSPVISVLIRHSGILATMRYLACYIFLLIVPLAQLLENPPQAARDTAADGAGLRVSEHDIPPAPVNFTFEEAVRTRTLWLCWGLFGLGGGCGVMVIGDAASLAKGAFGEAAWVSLVVMSLGNCAGRVLSGMLNDRIGLQKSVLFFFLFQASMMLGVVVIKQDQFKDSKALVLFVATFLGFNYGANPCLWSVAARSYFGSQSFGAIFGLMLTGWGVGSMLITTIGDALKAAVSPTANAQMGCALMLLSVALILKLEPPAGRVAAGVPSSEPPPESIELASRV